MINTHPIKFLIKTILFLLIIIKSYSQENTLNFPSGTFKGGTQEFFKIFSTNMYYPDIAVENRIVGTTILQFDINPKNEIINIAIINSLCPEIDTEILRTLKLTEGFWIYSDSYNHYSFPIIYQFSDIPFESNYTKMRFYPAMFVTVQGSIKPPKKDEYYLKLYKKSSESKNYQKMIESLNELIRRNPFNSRYFNDRSKCFFELGESEKGCKDLKFIKDFLKENPEVSIECK